MPLIRRFRRIEIGIIAVILVLLVVAYLVYIPDYRMPDPSIEYDKPFGNTRNGTAFDQALIPTGGSKRIIVPAAIRRPTDRRQPGPVMEVNVQRTKSRDSVILLLKKTLAFAGHTANGSDIRSQRDGYRVWLNRSANSMVVAIRPGWDSAIEGGLFLTAYIRVPEGVELVQKPYDDSAFSGWWAANETVNEQAPGWQEVIQMRMPANEFRAAVSSP
jgi:hypothetical protein